ncbi:hypothetical protein BS78_02G383400 [Paspalum vaginatum]|nr:hypothetical protein BS78_02G383400 [Paspalum vaginatum]
MSPYPSSGSRLCTYSIMMEFVRHILRLTKLLRAPYHRHAHRLPYGATPGSQRMPSDAVTWNVSLPLGHRLRASMPAAFRVYAHKARRRAQTRNRLRTPCPHADIGAATCAAHRAPPQHHLDARTFAMPTCVRGVRRRYAAQRRRRTCFFAHGPAGRRSEDDDAPLVGMPTTPPPPRRARRHLGPADVAVARQVVGVGARGGDAAGKLRLGLSAARLCCRRIGGRTR